MLLLTRGVGEKLKIGKDVFVTVLEVKSGEISFSIDAPREIQVARDEWFQLQTNRRSGCVSEVYNWSL